MELNWKIVFLNIFGIILFSFGIGALSSALYLRNLYQIFWMCYLSLLIIGIGILAKKPTWIASQANILALPVLVWNIDFLYQFITGNALWGLTDYFFYESTLTFSKIISLQHLFAVPLALYSIFLMGGLNRKDHWKISMVQATFVFIAVSLLTPKEFNINCVFDPCINVPFGLPHRLTWFLIFFVLIIITSFMINKLLYKEKKK